MEWIEPVSLKSTTKFSSSIGNIGQDEDLRIKHESNIAWFAVADRLDIVSTTCSGVQSRQFECTQGQDFEVTCVAAIPNEPLALVGLSSSTGSGAVALYNYSTSMILNSWSISHRVTCVCSMEIPNANYKHLLKSDCYLFALGTEEGHVMLMAIDQHFKFAEGTHQLDPKLVHYYTTDDVLHQRVFLKPPVVLVIPLNDPMYREGMFVLESMHENQAVLSVKKEDIIATVVKYVPQTQSLCVGYNMQGAFQLFSLKTLDLDFSGFASGCNNEQLDQVLDFAFLEPEDDPRHYCYLTVVGSKTNGSHHSPFAVLYSLTYVNKDTATDGGILYDELQYITLRLDINFGPLIAAEESNPCDVELLNIRSLPSSFTSPMNINSTRATPCNGVCFLAMQSSSSVYITIFDLNQWYQAQMPSRWIFDDLSTVCPFVGFYRIKVHGPDARQFWIEPNTLSIFHRSAITPHEAFFYPSALSFRAFIVSPVEATSILFLGLQSLLLHKLSQTGSQALNQPQRLYVHAVKAGLTPPEVAAPSVFQMAEALLNIGLENNSRSFLISCIKDEGANLNLVEKWAWQQVVNLKTLRENLCQILFDHSAQELEQQMHTQLYHVTHQFNNLAVLYDVMDKKIRSLNSGVNDKLREKARAIHLLSLHLETVLWFLHGGLLPEVDEAEREASSLPYPRHHMERFYRNRKREIEGLSSTVKAHEVLLVEQLIPKSVAELWAEERGSSELTYPPPSLYALLSAYLRPDVDDVTKHRLVQYVFMDLTWIYEQHEHFGNVLQHLVTFPSTYSLKPSMIKVTQAFWHLDHQNFDDALGVLLDPLVHATDITNAQQRAILRAFLYQDQRRHALKYATLRHPVCPELEDIQLHLTILIANNLISDALNYIRRNRNQRNGTELMQHMLSGCHEMRKFSVLLTLPLTEEEEEHVTSYLKQSRNLDLQEALLLFYIQRCKYPDAITYNQRLNQMWPARDATSRERYNRREMLMQTLVGALPPITCKLASIVNLKPTGTIGSKHPKPLSIAVLPATSKVQSQGSNFFRTVIEQSRATWLIEQKVHQEVQSPLRTRKRKLDVPEERSMEPESTPFLCNIVQPTKRNVTLGMSLTFPSPRFADTSSMDITKIDPDVSQPKQSKRPRYSLFPKAVAPKTDSEVISILNTPPVRRSRPSVAPSEAPGSCNRPSSILKDKMKRFMNFSALENQISLGDAQQTEHDTDMEVSMLDISSAKQLRFSLPRAISLEQTSPEQAPAENIDVSMSEKSQLAEDSQFLSFEESEKEEEPSPKKDILTLERTQVKVKETKTAMETTYDQMELSTMAPVIIERIRQNVVYVEEQQEEEREDGITETVVAKQTELTERITLETSIEASVEEKETVDEVDKFTEKAIQEFDRSTEEPVEELEKSAESEILAEDYEWKRQQPSPRPSDDESDIVCLDSASDEEPVQSKEADQDEEENYQEEEYGEDEQEESEQGGEEETSADVEEAADEAGDTDENVEEEEQEDAEPVISVSSTAQSSSVVELLSDEDRELMAVAERAREANERTVCHTVDMSTCIIEDVKQETEELGNDQESVVEEKSVEEEEEESEVEQVESEEMLSTTSVTTRSMCITKQRFTMSSSEESSSSEGEGDREKELIEYARRRHHNVSVYSEVEPDLVESDSSETPAQPEEAGEIEEDEEEPLEVPTYTTIETDSEVDEVMDVDEQDSLNEISERKLADDSIALERSVPVTTATTNETVQETEDQEEEEDEGDNFELRFSDTPNVSRRASQFAKRFSLGSAAGSDDEDVQEQAEQHDEAGQSEQVDQEEEQEESIAVEQSVQAQQLVEPEESPMKAEQDSDSGDEETPARKTVARSTRSSMFRTRLQLTDSESSDTEELPTAEEKADSAKEEETSPVEEATVKHIQAEDVEEIADEAAEHEYQDNAQSVERPAIESSTEIQNEEAAGPEADEIAAEVEPERPESDDTVKLVDEVSLHSDTSTVENVSLKEILQRHERFDVPLIPDAGVMITDRDLSTIVEERTFDQSTAFGLNQTDKATLESLEEEPETAPENEQLVHEEPGEVVEPKSESPIESIALSEQDSGAKTEALDVGMMNSDVVEPPTLTDNEEEEEKQQEVKRRGRPSRSKSVRLSQVPLPFTSRKSVWDASTRDRSPESATSEPPQSLDESSTETTRTRRRRHSASLSSAPVAARRSTRRSIQLNETIGTPVKEELRTPQKSERTSQMAGEKDADDAFIPPSIDVSPAESSYSGRSSLVGTPVRRSARLALREKTPEPSGPTEALMSSLSRIRRHSTGPSDVASPVRRSGRKSLNMSREASPDSITSEPPPRTETTPSRRPKSTRGLRSAQKAAVHNLFPVEEEAEALNDAPSVSVRDSDDSVSIDDSESVADTSIASVTSAAKKTRKPRGSSRPSSAASSVTSSPASTRYNLRRGRRASELDIVPEEDQNRTAVIETAELAVKRIREAASEDSAADQAGPANEEEADTVATKQTVRSKRRKKAEEQEEPAEEIHFAPASRPPPKNLPKREPVIKSRSSIRRSMKLDK